MADPFARDLGWFLEGHNRRVAINSLQQYFAGFTGSRFDRLADHEHPNEITTNEIVAVSTLGVDIPAPPPSGSSRMDAQRPRSCSTASESTNPSGTPTQNSNVTAPLGCSGTPSSRTAGPLIEVAWSKHGSASS